MKEWYKITFAAKMNMDDIQAMNKRFYQAMEDEMLINSCANLVIKDKPSNPAEKKWCQITFNAMLDEEDVLAMKGCFYEAMEKGMGIAACAGLQIEKENIDE